MPNSDIRKFLDAIWQEGDVREIRSFAEDGSIMYGYFDSPEIAEKAALSLIKTHTIYCTLNPCKPAIMARKGTENKLVRIFQKSNTKGTATSDKDIARLDYILVDCDPERPAETSASDAEVKMAEEVSQKILAKYGKPIIYGMSGNGFHLIYKHSLTKNCKENVAKLQQFLVTLAKEFDTDEIKIDRVVFNPGRITKVLGTWARKGDNYATRG